MTYELKKAAQRGAEQLFLLCKVCLCLRIYN